MKMKHQWLLPAALLVAEYLLFSALFDAFELMPHGLDGLGEVAPIPVIVAVALFILGASATAPPVHVASVPTVPPLDRRWALLLAAHLVAYAVFLAVSRALRSEISSSGSASIAFYVAWAAIGTVTVGLLAAAALPRAGLLAVARRAAGPLGVGTLVGLAAWSAGRSSGELWEPLSRWTLHPVGALVGAFNPDLVFDAERFEVGTSRFSVTVAAVCSGYEGMGLVAVLVGAYVWTFRRTLRFPHAIVLPMVAIALAYGANILRIAALIHIGSAGAPEVAIGGFHSKAGWVLFCGIALGTTWVARSAALFQRHPSQSEVEDNPTAAYVTPLLALVAAALVTGLASDGRIVERLEFVRLAAAAIALWIHRDVLREAVRGAVSWVGPAAGVVTFALWMVLVTPDQVTDATIAQELSGLPTWQVVAWVGTRVIGSVLIVPVVEELAFRGFLLRRLVSADFAAVSYRQITLVAVLVSSVAFGVLHDHWVAGIAAGLVYAGAVWIRGRLADAVVAHVVTNALVALVALGGGRWSLW